jgi:cytochrome b561
MRGAGSSRYTAVAMILHWLIAAGVLGLIVMGYVMTRHDTPVMTKFQLFQLHKSVGITVLGLMLLRLFWRLGHRPPPLPEAMPALERRAAHGTHHLLYLLLFALPLTGWIYVSTAPLNIPTVLYGLIPWPHLPVLPERADKADIAVVADDIHSYGGWILAALVLLHAAAALRHHFMVRDDVLRRMLPPLPGKTP